MYTNNIQTKHLLTAYHEEISFKTFVVLYGILPFTKDKIKHAF